MPRRNKNTRVNVSGLTKNQKKNLRKKAARDRMVDNRVVRISATPVRSRPKRPTRRAPAPPRLNNETNMDAGSDITSAVNGRTRLSHCATAYARSLADPFGNHDACVPVFPALKTEKVHAFVRGTMQTSGTTGWGFVALTPTPCNDIPCCYTSTFGFTGTNINTVGTGILTHNNNSPWSSVNVKNYNVKLRPVSIGIKIKYSGTELNRGGTYYLLEEPMHDDMTNYGVTDLESYDSCRRETLSNGWHAICMSPVDTTLETAFLDGSQIDQQASPVNLNYFWNRPIPINYSTPRIPCAILIQTPAVAGGIPFDYEVSINFEAAGELARSKIQSHVDTAGQQAVAASFQQGKEERKSPWQILGNIARNYVLPVAASVLTGDMSYASNALARALT